MTVLQNIVGTVELQGLFAYLAILVTFLGVLAWATYRDHRSEYRRRRTYALKAAILDEETTPHPNSTQVA
jgi:hypothetical protein